MITTSTATATEASTDFFNTDPVILSEVSDTSSLPNQVTTPVSTLYTEPVTSTAYAPTPIPRSSVKPNRGVEVKSDKKLYSLYTVDSSKSNIWYLTRPSEGWCMPNHMLAELLGVKSDHLLKLGQKYNRGRMHTAAPSSFYLAGNASKRNRRVNKTYMWYSSDILWLLNEHVPTLDEETRDEYAEKRKELETYTAFSFLRTNTAHETAALPETPPAPVEQPPAPALHTNSINDTALNHLAEVLTDFKMLIAEISNLREANTILTREKEALNITLSKQLKAGSQSSDITPAAGISQPGFNLNRIDSLNKFLSKAGIYDHAEDLTRAGLFNATEIYSMNSANWEDPTTGLLINKEKFFEIVRSAFHTADSNKTAPSLQAWAMRDNCAAVCRVRCPKVDPQVSTPGTVLDFSNPAYTTNTDICVRPQARYTSKAINHLVSNWTKLVLEYYDRTFQD